MTPMLELISATLSRSGRTRPSLRPPESDATTKIRARDTTYVRIRARATVFVRIVERPPLLQHKMGGRLDRPILRRHAPSPPPPRSLVFFCNALANATVDPDPDPNLAAHKIVAAADQTWGGDEPMFGRSRSQPKLGAEHWGRTRPNFAQHRQVWGVFGRIQEDWAQLVQTRPKSSRFGDVRAQS